MAESYSQDVLALSRKVNLYMPEDKKLAHFMKGIVEDLNQILLALYYQTIDYFVKHCRQI